MGKSFTASAEYDGLIHADLKAVSDEILDEAGSPDERAPPPRMVVIQSEITFRGQHVRRAKDVRIRQRDAERIFKT